MKNNPKFHQKQDYTILLKQYEDGSFFAQIEELLGCITEGWTKEEALEMIEDAKNAWLEVTLQESNTIHN